MSRRVFYLFWVIVILNAAFNTALQLHYDEAYYWTWSQNLDFSYYDHPPLLAYLIKLTTIFGSSEFYVRLGAVICGASTILLIYKLAQKAFNQKTAEIALILALAWPILQGTFFIITPDAPLLLFWTATLFTCYVAVFEQRSRWWYLTGILAGLGMLSKYTAVLIFPSIFIFLLLNKEYRYILLRKEVYIACVLALLVFSPVIYWNYTHEWISFKYQFAHGVSESKHLDLMVIGNFWGAQFGGANPFIFMGLVYYIIRYWNNNFSSSKLAFFLCPFLFVLGFFAYNGLFKMQEGNWPAPAYISAIIFTAYYLDKYSNKWIYRCALGSILIIYPFIKMPTVLLPDLLVAKIPAINAFFGNHEILQQIKPLVTPSTDVIACDYSTASRAWYYLGQRTYIVGNFKFANNYKYWQPKTPIKRAIFICDTNNNFEPLNSYFKQVEYIGAFVYKNAFLDNQLYVYQANN